ncbi:hypothetical protein EHQ49_05235 [Leptospira perdikensis]|uniref:Uncharacterized protein n=1 Tax=Leptospira perdikensis TaxID=2484948 RepID=A0A4R9JKY2_9LEPT|nr:hypothetical protein EHQ49_05235 [Leptospira perdikensis]
MLSLVSFFLFVSAFLFVGCASLLPEERRMYPHNPVSLPNGMNIHNWINAKETQFNERFGSKQIGEAEYKFNFYRKELTSIGSYISCTAMVRSKTATPVELYNLVSMVNYADYTKFMRKGGDLGPMSEKESTEILLPCMEEFLEPPKTKE